MIVVLTILPGDVRPETPMGPDVERMAAFFLLGFMIGFGHRQNWIILAGAVFGAAVLIEMFQAFIPDRHAALADIASKAIGGMAGLGAGRLVLSWMLPAEADDHLGWIAEGEKAAGERLHGR